MQQPVELVAVGKDQEGLHERQQRLPVAPHSRLHRRRVALATDREKINDSLFILPTYLLIF